MDNATPEKKVIADSTEKYIPHRYIWGALSLFLVLVAGIILPDLLQYWSSQQANKGSCAINGQRSVIEIVITNDVGGILTTNILVPIGNGTNTTIVSYVTNSPSINVRIIASQTASQLALNVMSTNVPQVMPGAITTQPMQASASFFEAYARLITLMLSILSVLGLFFAYFLRKSLHEIEDGVEKRVDRTLKSWEEDQIKIKKQIASDADETKKMYDETSKLYINIKKLEEGLTDAMDELDRAKQREIDAKSSSNQDVVADASGALDQELSEQPTSREASAPEVPKE